ncbi:hypothetical protein [Synechococcus sp. MU1642]|uniref:hypothetical protein n=1 Tax=Synechococcus sp. MU1642 TaxID=2508348 RepID=UPI001CF914FA|nr:hypothetical protein [Synechococcus sp. MU1642]
MSLNKEARRWFACLLIYDLILQRKGELQAETVQVADAAQAWRLGRERYPHSIRGVVRRDGSRSIS